MPKNSFQEYIVLILVLKLKNLNTGFELYPQISKTSENSVLINLNNLTLEAGQYVLLSENQQVGTISLNYDRKESNLEFYIN